MPSLTVLASLIIAMFRLAKPKLRVKEPTLNDLQPMMAKDERRREILTKSLATSPRMVITNQRSPYYESYALLKQESMKDLTRYENSILWSPHFTPKKFKWTFAVPAVLVAMLLLYLRYIGTPRRMLELKKRLGIRFKELEKRGWLDGW